MSEQDKLWLTDKDTYPTDDYISTILGERMSLWRSITDYMTANYAGSAGKWNFYNDGKRWLFKMEHKKKTVFWGTLLNDSFRITFYLGNKAETIIAESDLPDVIKEDFKTAKRYGQIRPVTLMVNDKTDVNNVYKMIVLKSKAK